MDKIGIFVGVPDAPKNFLTLNEELDTIDLDVLNEYGEWQGTLIQINKETLKVTTPGDLNSDLGFERTRKGEIQIYEVE